MLDLLPVQTSSLQFVIMNELKKVYARRFVTFYFLLGSSMQCLLSVGIRMRIALMNNAPPKLYLVNLLNNAWSVYFIHFKYCFSQVFKHRTDWCLVSCFLYPLIVYFQIIVRQYYNYCIDVRSIIWQPFFHVE